MIVRPAPPGMLHLNGAGVPADTDAAVMWLTRAAEQDDAGAQYYRGMLYRVGKGGGTDDALAARWLKRAASAEAGAIRAKPGLEENWIAPC